MFDERLKELREESGLSQNQVARTIGYTQSNLAKWERKIHDPPTNAIIALAKLFNVSTDYLLGLEDDFGNKQFPSDISEPQIQLSPTDRQILQELQEMDEFQKQNVLGYIHGFRRVAFSVKKTNRD